MNLNTAKFNRFLLFKIPAAWMCGVRVRELSLKACTTSVRYKWINQNPFNSMFWAVQGMAAELSTGALIMAQLNQSTEKFSTLVINNKASFTKKAKGRITFSCSDGLLVMDARRNALETGLGQVFWMTSQGIDENGDVVSTFHFEWSIKLKT